MRKERGRGFAHRLALGSVCVGVLCVVRRPEEVVQLRPHLVLLLHLLQVLHAHAQLHEPSCDEAGCVRGQRTYLRSLEDHHVHRLRILDVRVRTAHKAEVSRGGAGRPGTGGGTHANSLRMASITSPRDRSSS